MENVTFDTEKFERPGSIPKRKNGWPTKLVMASGLAKDAHEAQRILIIILVLVIAASFALLATSVFEPEPDYEQLFPEVL